MSTPRAPFFAKLLASYLMLIALVQVVTVFALDRSLRPDLMREATERLEEQAWAVASWVSTSRHPERLAQRLAHLAGARVTLTDRAGNVLADSAGFPREPPRLHPEGMSPELGEAQQGRVGYATRNTEEGEAIQYVAVPVRDGMAVRLGRPLAEVQTAVEATRRRVLLAAVVGFGLALGLALVAARVVIRPVRAMTRAATRIAGGHYDVELPAPARDELGALSTALGSMAEQLQARFRELQTLEESRRRFLADAAHELRTPVTAIRGFSQTLLEEGAVAPGARSHAEIIHRHSVRIGKLLEDLLSLSHLDAHPQSTGPLEAVYVEGLVQRVQRTFRDQAASMGARVDYELEPGLRALVEPDALERILENLVGNALKYGRRGGTVTLTGARAQGKVRLQVRDDGPGIAAEHLPRLFERFYRVDQGRAREQGGTGLGLAIVKQLAESMGGQVTVESVVGQGSVFTVELPEATAPAAPG